jgi:hypothetical protein
VRAITSFAEYGFPECVVGDTQVLDAETGCRVRIEDVVAGRAVLGHTLACDADLKLRRRRVLEATASGRRMVYRLRTVAGREIVATWEHPVLTKNGWRPLGGLRLGSTIGAMPETTARREGVTVDWDRIAAIEPVGHRETYDLEIEDDHNFLANDLVVHNSQAASFALLAYASAYLKVHYPAQFYGALLNNQPMGFYHPATLVKDAQRHGQAVRPVDVVRSEWRSTVEQGAVRLGLMTVKGFREASAQRLVETRRARPFASVDDLMARAGLARDELTRLAEIGALAPLGLSRRAALWETERAARPTGPLWSGQGPPPEASPLPEMTAEERLVADYRGTALTVGPHPMVFRRADLARAGVTPAAQLARTADGTRVRIAGAVIVRQRPGTAKGFVFLSLEDETGIANAIVRPALFARDRAAIVHEPFVLVEGLLQHQDGVVSVRATRVHPLPPLPAALPSHDFH